MPLKGARGSTDLTLVVAAFDQLWTINPEDIAADWIAAMAKRLLAEINRQLSSLESIKYDNATSQPSTGDRLTNAKALASLHTTLEKVSRSLVRHEGTVHARKSRDYATARAEIERVVDGVFTDAAAPRGLPAPER
jgi:hypothetical protein